MGLPVLQRSSSCRHAVANTPAESSGALFARFPKNGSLPRIHGRIGFRITLSEACSAFTLVTACLLAKSPGVTLYTEGFSRFVCLHDCSDCYRLERKLPGGVRIR